MRQFGSALGVALPAAALGSFAARGPAASQTALAAGLEAAFAVRFAGVALLTAVVWWLLTSSRTATPAA